MTTCYPLTGLINMSVFSERLKLLRSARNITQTRLAELVEADPRVYNRWERGIATPQLDTVVKIADILQVSMDELTGRTQDMTEPKIHNHELFSLYHQVDDLPDEDQQALILVIDSFIKKTQMTKVMGKAKA